MIIIVQKRATFQISVRLNSEFYAKTYKYLFTIQLSFTARFHFILYKLYSGKFYQTRYMAGT